ncbi:probable E3 ubiquitin-protein ligase RHB1A isoform X2 [Mangifera indica]|uniref:probable E3 ubiquitin-protein ligase RHB1A isoform X2 n=1 Tax=Mangifera indica TaxID=29780 RepID=UPI001CFA6CB8|nr:probable E3 ubiquitin-protein ligase RHB1A isoform X2 [Mangifera indica]
MANNVMFRCFYQECCFQCPAALEEKEALTSHSGIVSTFRGGLLIDFHLEASTPDTFRPPPAPLPYDVVFGCLSSTDSESVEETISGSSFETSPKHEDLEELDCKTQASSLLISPRKSEVAKLNESIVAEEDTCPICLEEYDKENPKLFTKCKHHFHLSCILEWNERSDSCPICDQRNQMYHWVFMLQPLCVMKERCVLIVTGNYIQSHFD